MALKYLSVLDARYGGEFETIEDPRVGEAATAYGYALRKGKVASHGIGKVVLVAPAQERRVEDLIDVLRYEHPLGDHAEVNALAAPHERWIGEAHQALFELGEPRGWDLDALDAIRREVADAGYRFHVVQIKPKANPARTIAVGVEWRTSDVLEIGFTVTSKGGETRWVPFLAARIGLGKIDAAARKLAWRDDQTVVLEHGNKRDFWTLDVETLQVNFHYLPADQGNPHGQYALGKMYLDGMQWVNVDRDAALYWLRKSADQGFARARTLLQHYDRQSR